MSPTNTLRFTKMHGAGNDFVVLDNRDASLNLMPDFIKRLSDRHFGVGADQVLVIERPQSDENDFRYRIFNADGQEVQQCGNGARCFAQYVSDKGLSTKLSIRVETIAGVIEPKRVENNWVQVNMGPASFEPSSLPFIADGLSSRKAGGLVQYRLPIDSGAASQDLWVAVVSMGNPHVVILLDQPARDEQVQTLGAILESHPRFPERVNVGFLNIVDRNRVHLRVYERGVGETLACGTGACAAAVAGMRMGLLSDKVDVVKTGGTLTIQWAGEHTSDVFMTGPAQTVFEGEFYL